MIRSLEEELKGGAWGSLPELHNRWKTNVGVPCVLFTELVVFTQSLCSLP